MRVTLLSVLFSLGLLISLCSASEVQFSLKIHFPSIVASSAQPHGERAGKGVVRNRTIKISRATRVSEQWNASLDREITNANELRHLDEFLGNQVSKTWAHVVRKHNWVFLYLMFMFVFFIGEWFPLQGEITVSHRGHLCHCHHAVQRDYQSHVLSPSEFLCTATYALHSCLIVVPHVFPRLLILTRNPPPATKVWCLATRPRWFTSQATSRKGKSNLWSTCFSQCWMASSEERWRKRMLSLQRWNRESS